MQYTPHYNLNLPEGTDIVNPLVQDNPNYSAIDTALYDNKLRVVGTATHVKTGTNHAITLADSDINQFKFVATGDYATGDTFTVDGVTVTPRIADGSTIPNGAFKINSTVLCILDGTILNFINAGGIIEASDVYYDNTLSGIASVNVQGAIDEISNALNYSTAEHVIGKWIDGTTLYEKTVDFGSLPNNAEKTVAHGITNINKIVEMIGTAYNTVGEVAIPIPLAVSTNTATDLPIQTSLTLNSSNVIIKTGSNRTAFDAWVTIRYTKTI